VRDLFDPVVGEGPLSESFKTVARSPGYAPARAAMLETFARMGQSDGNFLEQFQTCRRRVKTGPPAPVEFWAT
jgi:hypothetical protein